MKNEKIHGKKSQREKGILTAIVILCALAVCVAGYGIWSVMKTEGTEADRVVNGKIPDAEDPLGIRSIVVGDKEGQVQTVTEGENTSYVIKVTLPADFPFEKTTLNLELSDGAVLSDQSNCLLADLGGRPVVNLTVEDACLIIENGEESREYRFLIELE